MSKSKGRKQPTSAAVSGEFKGFINPQIGDEVKTAVKALDLTAPHTVARLVELSQSGLKVSLRWNDKQDSFMVTLYDQREATDSKGYAMTLFHSDLSVAIALAWFLQETVYTWEGWGKWVQPSFDVDW